MPLTAAQVTMFTTWVNGGGNLIAMRPDKQPPWAARPVGRQLDADERIPALQHSRPDRVSAWSASRFSSTVPPTTRR